MARYDHTTNPPTEITTDMAKAYTAELSQLAQAAEINGDQVMADFLHSGINQELDAITDPQ